MHLEFNVIGAGRLGKNLALALNASGLGKLKAICNRHLASAQAAVKIIGAGIAVESLADLPPVDVTFITSADDVIHSIAKQLAQISPLRTGSIIAHCSGVLNSTELMPLKKFNCQLVSIHPLKAFNQQIPNADIFKHCDCVMEGDAAAVSLLKNLFQKLEANVFLLQAQTKTLYHAAATMASNYLVTLAATSTDLLKTSGIDMDVAQPMIVRLMTNTLSNIQQAKEVKDALTGPLARGDLGTINKHVTALSNTIHSSTLLSFYRSAALATLPLTNLEETVKQLLVDSLESIRD